MDKYAPETCCVVGNYYSLKGQHDRAIVYFQRALSVDPAFLSAWTLMGHEYMELRNTATAITCYRQVLYSAQRAAHSGRDEEFLFRAHVLQIG